LAIEIGHLQRDIADRPPFIASATFRWPSWHRRRGIAVQVSSVEVIVPALSRSARTVGARRSSLRPLAGTSATVTIGARRDHCDPRVDVTTAARNLSG
jgi:hypothetical protein